jgi:uncharacterized protein (TIGR03435 family)
MKQLWMRLGALREEAYYGSAGTLLRKMVSMFLSRYKGPSGFKVCQVVALLILGIAVSLTGFEQSQAQPNAQQPAASAPVNPQAAPANKLTFEVASVRPGRKFFLKGADFLDPVNKEAPPPKGGLYSWNVPVGYLIYFAYDLRSAPLRRDMWEHLPQWTRDEYYAVEARADGDPSREDVRQMVRSLLEDRFKLTVHSGTRDGQVNELTVVKPGVGLKPHVEGAPCELTLPPTPTPSAYPPYKDFPVRCGVFDRELGKYKRRIEMVDVTMQQIADTLSSHSTLSVVDSTGLTGHYDAILDYGPEILPPDADPDAEVGSPVSVAMEKQLGLKLVKKSATVEFFVIDHIEKPSEN